MGRFPIETHKAYATEKGALHSLLHNRKAKQIFPKIGKEPEV
jgi:hypothetical protein